MGSARSRVGCVMFAQWTKPQKLEHNNEFEEDNKRTSVDIQHPIYTRGYNCGIIGITVEC